MSDFTKHPEFGPYLGIFGDTKITLERGGRKRTFRFAGYHAFSAGGLIGSERNGVVILDEDAKAVLADDVGCASSSYASDFKAGVTKIIEQLKTMAASEFETFVMSQPRSRYRGSIFDGLQETPTSDFQWRPKNARAPTITTQAALKEIIDIEKRSGAYGVNLNDQETKDKFHARSVLVLRRIAKQMGLATGTYEVRSNRGGVAVMGEITLHAENVYIQFSCSVPGRFMYRGCRNRTDYSGFENRWMAYAELKTHFSTMIEEFQKLAAESAGRSDSLRAPRATACV